METIRTMRRRSIGVRCVRVAITVALVALAAPATARAACDPLPRGAGCKRTTDARDLIDIAGSFPFAPFSSRDRVIWKIPKLEATSSAELPDPMTTDYAVCFYVLDDHEEFVLGHQLIAPAGLGCGRPRCWTRNAKGGVGYNGGPLKRDGIASLRVNPGSDGKAQLALVGRGENLQLPGAWRIFGGELIMQLQAGASCWSALYVNFGEPPAIRTNSHYRMTGSTIR